MIRLSGSVKLSCAFSSGSPYSRLYGRPPFRLRFEPGSRPRASSASRCLASNRALAARIAASRSSRRRNSSGNSSPRCASPKRASSAASVSRARDSNASISPSRRRSSSSLGGHPKAAIKGHLKTGQRK